MAALSEKLVLAIDCGGTGIKAVILNSRGKQVGNAFVACNAECPHPGWVEYNAEDMFEKVATAITEVLSNAHITAGDLACMGISNQRSTFVLWDAETECLTEVGLSIGATIAHFVTRSHRFLGAKLFAFRPVMSIIRVKWCLENIPETVELSQQGRLRFGTLDSWLLHKFSGGTLHATDPSNISATGFFEPFTQQYPNWFHAQLVLGLPCDPSTGLLPKIIDTSGDFGATDPALFGAAIPIRAVCGDQSASLFGHTCFKRGEVKCTHGTGTFVTANTGHTPMVSKHVLFPVVGWSLPNEPYTYILEATSGSVGNMINWGKDTQLYDDPADTERLACSVPDCGGVVVVPAFEGLMFPNWNGQARGAVFGLTCNSTKAHVVRAALEGIAYRTMDMVETMRADTGLTLNSIMCDGGVVKNDFIVQFMADMLNAECLRARDRDVSVLGAAFLAGLYEGVVWQSLDDLKALHTEPEAFHPTMDPQVCAKLKERWRRAVQGVIRAAGPAVDPLVSSPAQLSVLPAEATASVSLSMSKSNSDGEGVAYADVEPDSKVESQDKIVESQPQNQHTVVAGSDTAK